MFCPECGTKVVGGKFCMECGTRLPESAAHATTGSPAPAQNVSNASSPPQAAPAYSAAPPSVPTYSSPTPAAGLAYQSPPPPPPRPGALFDAAGNRTEAFNQLASAIFTTIDQSCEPRGTHGLEPAKMMKLLQCAGKPLPAHTESILPMLCRFLFFFSCHPKTC